MTYILDNKAQHQAAPEEKEFRAFFLHLIGVQVLHGFKGSDGLDFKSFSLYYLSRLLILIYIYIHIVADMAFEGVRRHGFKSRFQES